MLLNLSKTVLKMGVNMNNVFIGESSFDADDIRSHLAQHKNNKGLSDLYINPRGDIVTHGNIVIDDYIDEVFTPDNIFMLGFESVQSLNFENSCISSFNRKCHIGESLSFEYCDDLGNLDLQNIKLGSMFVSNLLFSVCKNLHTLKNVYADNRIKSHQFLWCHNANLLIINQHQKLDLILVHLLYRRMNKRKVKRILTRKIIFSLNVE